MLTRRLRTAATAAGLSALALAATVAPTSAAYAASTSLSFAFDAAGEYNSYFDSFVSRGTVTQEASGGIGDSGAISTPDSEGTDAVISPKGYYTVGPVGSSYSFVGFMKSVGNSGYSGFGYTASTPSADTVGSSVGGGVFRPEDALGVSVHGGGFIFHNGATDTGGSWGSDNSGVTTVKKSELFDLLGEGSPADWYKVIVTITRASETTVDMQVEVWPALADGTLINPDEADAIFAMNDQDATALLSAPQIKSYINFSGFRMTTFDNFGVDLGGGATVGGTVPGGTDSTPTEPEPGTDDGADDGTIATPAAPQLAETGPSTETIASLFAWAMGALLVGGVALTVRRSRADY